jgi:diguanylate cyclase (GGDEF)-like protein
MVTSKLSVDPGRVDVEQLELKGFASSIAEIEWLLLLLIILYYLTPDAQVLQPAGLVASIVVFALFVLGFHYVNAHEKQKRWKLALETWVMILFITWVAWNTGGVESPLISLFLLVIIISAITLGRIVTLLEILLIGATYFFIAAQSDAAYSFGEFARVMIYFSPLVLVAYVTTLLVADLYNGRRLLQALADTDELTGLLNQGSFMRLYDRTCSEAFEHLQPLAALVIGVDNIGEVNEKYGLGVGDRLLKTVASILGDAARSNDLLCRYAGVEFVFVLPGFTTERSAELAERLRRAIANTSFDVDGDMVSATASIGIANFPTHVADVVQLLDRANESLWVSRRLGGNRVMHFEADISPG